MRIGTCVNFNAMEDMESKLITLKENQFDSCQLVCWNPAVWTEENAVVLKALLEKYGVTVSAFWCGWEGPRVWNFTEGPLTLGLLPVEYRQMRVQNLCDGADFAKLLGVEDVVTHMGFIPEDPNDPNFAGMCVAIRTVAQHLKANGQYLLFETGQETPVAMLRCFEKVGLDNLGVNLDTANLILYGKANPVDSLKVFGKYVRNLHAKDGTYPTNGTSLGNETKLGEGDVDFRGVFTKLCELGYDSFVTIENELRDGKELEEILESRAYLQSLIDEIYA